MRKWFVGSLLALTLMTSLLTGGAAHAASADIVIASLQTGSAAGAANEFIELYNNSSEPVDITGWCLYYASAGVLNSGSKLTCFTPDTALTHLFVPGHGFIFATSTILATGPPIVNADATFTATLAMGAGHVRLLDAGGNVVDKVGWGMSALSPEGFPALAPSTTQVLVRKLADPTTYQDTDNNAADFVLSTPLSTYTSGQMYEVQDVCGNIDGVQITVPDGFTQDSDANCLPPPSDACPNIDGMQIEPPLDFLQDSDGSCQPDSCLNLPGLQISVPDGMDADENGQCSAHDACHNFVGAQAEPPPGFYEDGNGNCLVASQPLELSELLPNPTGADKGNEFIEIYNPGVAAVDLDYYALMIDGHVVSFPANAAIDPGEFFVLKNSDISFTLVNSTSNVALETIDNQIVDRAPAYSDPPDGESWALVAGMWQYTNQPTPGVANLPALATIDDSPTATSATKPCAPNQYRNPATNRCKLIATPTTLTPCADGQYRSEVTDRCRTIALDGGTLKPCGDNQYRSETTNRCRNIVQITSAPDAIRPVTVSSDPTGWWVAGSVAAVAFGYAAWEWRRELSGAWQRASAVIRRR